MSLRHRLAAWRALWAHYGAVFAHAWQERKAITGTLLNEDEAAFLPAALSLQARPLSSTARWTGRVLMGLVLAALLWALLGKIDIIVTATGKVVPSGRTKTIASVDVAAVRALHVQEGQFVHAGDVLIELDTSASDAEHDKAQGDEVAAVLQVARSQALIDAVAHLRPPRMPRMDGMAVAMTAAQWEAARIQLEGQWQDFHARLQRLDGQIAQFAQDLPLVTQRAHDYKALLAEHDVAEHAWLEKEQARIDLAGQLSDAQNQRRALIAQTVKEAHDALTEGQKLAAANLQDARRASEHSKLLQLTSPVDGTVQQLNVHTVGSAVPAAQALMQIVPLQTDVEVEASIENKDVGFVQEGQRAAVKIDAFEYTKYGTIPARVTHVSRDAVPNERAGEAAPSTAEGSKKGTLQYVVKIALDAPTLFVDGKDMPITPGMSVSAEIKTGDRRVIEYVLSPLVQHAHESLHER